MSGWSFAAVWDGIAGEVPDRVAVVCGDRRLSWHELDDRAGRLARHLRQERDLAPGDRVAIHLVNRPEYLETFYAALKLGCVPVNVNYRYQAAEVHYLLDDSDAKVVVHEPSFAKIVRTAARRVPKPGRPMLLEVGEPYERAIAGAPDTGLDRAPDGDDLIFLYTGGTTGMPKGVMWRNDDLYRALWQMARPGEEPPDPLAAVRAGKRARTTLPACPLMHGTGLFITLSTLSGGGTVVLVDRPGLDPVAILDAVERENVEVLTIVGDAFARPLLAALDAEPGRWSLGHLRSITSSGVTFSPECKRRLLAHLPDATIIDSLGASEGLGTRSAARAGDAEIAPARFAVNDRVRVLDEHTGRDVTPGSNEVGLLAIGGSIPIGYWKDPAKTRATFKLVEGERYSVPGDYATVDADGTIRLLGRGSACVNTGGEKVYPEEVELALRKHPSVFDCVVLGMPDDRFGERVVALVQVTDNHYLDAEELAAWCRSRLAGYKTPRSFLFVDSLERTAAGKANYARLREVAAGLLGR